MVTPVFTIFTATYNRANKLQRVYDGLSSQTYQDFEWLIIDDGSTDGTGEVVEKWSREVSFPIRYYWQENSGKHIAHNLALEKARGEFFVVLDSDDSVVPAALERLLSLWESIPEEQKDDFCGAAALCMDQHGKLVGQPLPSSVIDASILEMRFIHKRNQEFIGFYRTAILKQYPFPEVKGVRFIPEGLVWSQIGQTYKIRYANEPLRIYYTGDEPNNLMKANPLRLAASHSLWHQFTLDQEIGWFQYAPWYFYSSAVHYTRFSLHNRQGLLAQFLGLQNSLARLLWFFALPAGLAIYFIDRMLSLTAK
ncbi:MAG: glycosyltransferase family 2 protein [Chloroflexi bacterium]|nr:glycosyltransferase family 2 protein [Chloroflexota bacterium]